MPAPTPHAHRRRAGALGKDPADLMRLAPPAAVGHVAPASREDRRTAYLNRELSWLDYNARVLFEASDVRNPLLERVRLLAIFAEGLDEFFAVRVAGLHELQRVGSSSASPDGLSAAEQLALIRTRAEELVRRQTTVFKKLRRELAAVGIEIKDYKDIPEHHERLRDRFIQEIFPVLTPLAVDPAHPFPYISTLSLSLAVNLRDPGSGEKQFARVKVPAVLPRLLEVGAYTFVLVEQVIAANLEILFSGMEVLETHLFRLTRDTDLSIQEDEADDLLLAIEQELRRRPFGDAVRLEVERSMPARTRTRLLRGTGLEPKDCYEVRGMLDLSALSEIAALDRPELHSAAWTPVVPPRLRRSDEDAPADVFAAIRQGDILVDHPYESFTASVERFISQAADDPDVLTIKQTLYRTSGDSPIVHELIRAAEQGKQVVVVVEIKARFDEQANIVWARKLEKAGAHVVYGLVGLKTHCKVCLVVRREGGGIRRYVHIGTGNYNTRTARQYVDLGLFTCRPEIGADATDLFNVLTGHSRQRSFRRLWVAPLTLRTAIMAMIDREIDHAAAGAEARIVLKVNALVDPDIITALYRASEAGVQVDVIARSMCSLRPGVPGLSKRVRVRSIVGEFLEHSRIFGFANNGAQEWYIGSADLMERNLDRRVEAMVPIEDPTALARVAEIVDVMLADDRRSWELGRDATWRRTEEIRGEPGTIDTFAVLKALASGVEPRQQTAALTAHKRGRRGGKGKPRTTLAAVKSR